MSKERIKIIVTNWENGHVNTCDVDWLIEQAERVQELKNVNRVLKKANDGSERGKERLRKWVDELEMENERYREALESLVKQETLEKDIKTGKTAISYNGMIALKGL